MSVNVVKLLHSLAEEIDLGNPEPPPQFLKASTPAAGAGGSSPRPASASCSSIPGTPAATSSRPAAAAATDGSGGSSSSSIPTISPGFISSFKPLMQPTVLQLVPPPEKRRKAPPADPAIQLQAYLPPPGATATAAAAGGADASGGPSDPSDCDPILSSSGSNGLSRAASTSTAAPETPTALAVGLGSQHSSGTEVPATPGSAAAGSTGAAGMLRQGVSKKGKKLKFNSKKKKPQVPSGVSKKQQPDWRLDPRWQQQQLMHQQLVHNQQQQLLLQQQRHCRQPPPPVLRHPHQHPQQQWLGPLPVLVKVEPVELDCSLMSAPVFASTADTLPALLQAPAPAPSGNTGRPYPYPSPLQPGWQQHAPGASFSIQPLEGPSQLQPGSAFAFACSSSNTESKTGPQAAPGHCSRAWQHPLLQAGPSARPADTHSRQPAETASMPQAAAVGSAQGPAGTPFASVPSAQPGLPNRAPTYLPNSSLSNSTAGMIPHTRGIAAPPAEAPTGFGASSAAPAPAPAPAAAAAAAVAVGAHSEAAGPAQQQGAEAGPGSDAASAATAEQQQQKQQQLPAPCPQFSSSSSSMPAHGCVPPWHMPHSNGCSLVGPQRRQQHNQQGPLAGPNRPSALSGPYMRPHPQLQPQPQPQQQVPWGSPAQGQQLSVASTAWGPPAGYPASSAVHVSPAQGPTAGSQGSGVMAAIPPGTPAAPAPAPAQHGMQTPSTPATGQAAAGNSQKPTWTGFGSAPPPGYAVASDPSKPEGAPSSQPALQAAAAGTVASGPQAMHSAPGQSGSSSAACGGGPAAAGAAGGGGSMLQAQQGLGWGSGPMLQAAAGGQQYYQHQNQAGAQCAAQQQVFNGYAQCGRSGLNPVVRQGHF